MINVHMASKVQSAQAGAVISRPGMVIFWILFATLSLVVAITLGIAISSIPSKVPLTQRERVWQVRDVARDSFSASPAVELLAMPALSPSGEGLLSANSVDMR